ncbi:hypothetical protein [Microtetraspora fusca]|uniref:hypothetical protein n=1 Tax=Microtetraspora fusca TaxID=1997 RepID=UPI00082E60E0|nr:hypothetical protein [Microtetraspora fusca]
MERDRYDTRYGAGRATAGEEPVWQDTGSEGGSERHSRFEGPGPVYSPEEAEGTQDAGRTGESEDRTASVAPEGFEPRGPVRHENVMPPAHGATDTGRSGSGGAYAFERPEAGRSEIPTGGERPGDVGRTTAESEPELAGIDVERRWRDIKAAFVDDPRGSVEQADALVEEAVSAVTERRRRLTDHWKNPDIKDTEELRLALREYRTLLTRLTGK